MTVVELRRIVRERGRDADFSIRSAAAPGMLPNDVTVLEPSTDQPGRWVVYYTERGRTWTDGVFDDESSACEYVVGLLGG